MVRVWRYRSVRTIRKGWPRRCVRACRRQCVCHGDRIPLLAGLRTGNDDVDGSPSIAPCRCAITGVSHPLRTVTFHCIAPHLTNLGPVGRHASPPDMPLPICTVDVFFLNVSEFLQGLLEQLVLFQAAA